MLSIFSRRTTCVLATAVVGALGLSGTAIADPITMPPEAIDAVMGFKQRDLRSEVGTSNQQLPSAAVAPADAQTQSSHRVVDTREGLGHNGVIQAGQEITFSVAGSPGFRAGERLNVSLNVTAVNAQADGFVSVHSADAPRTQASNLNYAAGDTVSNHVLTQTADNGYVTLYVHGATHIVVDVMSVHPHSWGVSAAVEPARALDTRLNGAQVGAGQSVVVKPHAGMFTGAPSSPAAWVINTTAVNPTSDGYLTVHPAGTERPGASNINYSAGQTIAGLSMVHSTPDEGIHIYSHGATDVVVDVVGWVNSSGSFTPMTPARAFDSRQNPEMFLYKTVNPESVGVPPGGASAVLVNITAVPGAFPGYVTAFRATGPKPSTSVLNHAGDQVISNSAFIPVAQDGSIRLFQRQNGHLVVDVLGYVAGAPEPDPAPIPLSDVAIGGVPFPVADSVVRGYGRQFGAADVVLAQEMCSADSGLEKARTYSWQDFSIATHIADPHAPEPLLEDWVVYGENLPGTLQLAIDPMIGATFDELMAAYPGAVHDRDVEPIEDVYTVSLPGTNYSWVLWQDGDHVIALTNMHKPCE